MLTDMGIESVHWYGIGTPNAKDTEIMAYAKEHDYVVLTCDLDFSAILSTTHGHKPSVVQLRTHGLTVRKVADPDRPTRLQPAEFPGWVGYKRKCLPS